MTIEQAENQYNLEVKNSIEQHKQQLSKLILIWTIISSVCILVGIILIVIGFSTPPEIDSLGFEWDTTPAILSKLFGFISLWIGLAFLLILIPFFLKNKKLGPVSFLPQIKNLYLNYLACEDLSENEREFYKQKLEDIRNAELVKAIRSASATASTAILFSMLKK